MFEGNNPADIESNHLLRRLLEDGPAGGGPRPGGAWLGDALAIKDPTKAVFRRQSGSSLLVIGQQAEHARAVLAAAAVALAAQDRRGATSTERVCPVTVLDGSPADDPEAGYFARLAAALPDHVRRRVAAGTSRRVLDRLGRGTGHGGSATRTRSIRRCS